MTLGSATRVPGLALGALLLSLGASAFAQHAFRTDAYATGVAASAVALVLAGLFAWRARLSGEGELLPPPVAGSALPSRPGALGVAAAALALLLALQAGDRAHALQLALLGVVVLGLLGAWQARPGAPAAVPRGEAGAALLVVGLALLARLWDLQNVPGGIYGDEGEFGLVGLRILEGEALGPFATAWDHHPTLFAWMQAGAMTLAGTDVAGLRLTSALAGGLTALPLYVLVRPGFGRTAAVAAALVLAASPWHVHLTRLASNNAWVCLLTVGTLAALVHGARSGAARSFVAAGVQLGAVFYFGNKAVSLPPTVLLVSAALLATGGVAVRRQWRLWLLVPATALVVALPQLAFYASEGWWGPFLKHPLNRLVDAPAEAERLAFFGDQLQRALLGPMAFGDRSLFRVPHAPALLTRAEATLYLTGLGLALASVRRPGSALLLAWLVVGTVTSLFDTRPPQSHHLIAVAPALLALAGIAAATAGAALGGWLRRPALAWAAVAALLAWTIADDVHSYHRVAARNWMMTETTELGRAMTAYAPSHQLVLVTPPMSWKLNSTLRFMARTAPDYTPRAELGADTRWFEPEGRRVAFLIDRRVRHWLPAIRGRYPGGVLETRHDSLGHPALFVYEVPAEALIEAGLPPPAVSASERRARPGSRRGAPR